MKKTIISILVVYVLLMVTTCQVSVDTQEVSTSPTATREEILSEMAITIIIGDVVLDGVIYDTLSVFETLPDSVDITFAMAE